MFLSPQSSSHRFLSASSLLLDLMKTCVHLQSKERFSVPVTYEQCERKSLATSKYPRPLGMN